MEDSEQPVPRPRVTTEEFNAAMEAAGMGWPKGVPAPYDPPVPGQPPVTYVSVSRESMRNLPSREEQQEMGRRFREQYLQEKADREANAAQQAETSEPESIMPTDARSSPIWIDPERVSGALCFAGTRVPVRHLWDYLASGEPLADFLEGFPGVTREQVIGVLELAYQRLVADSHHP